MRHGLVVVGLVAALGFSCGRERSEPASGTNGAAAATAGGLSAPADYLGAVNRAGKSAVESVDLASVQQAIQQYQAGEKRAPETLEDLVTKGYLAALPIAPAGQHFVYDRATGRVRLVPKR